LSQSCRCPSHGSSSNFLMPRQAISTSNCQEDDHFHLHISYHCILAVCLGPSKPRICTVFACFTPVLDHVNKPLLFKTVKIVTEFPWIQLIFWLCSYWLPFYCFFGHD
jgi:hypothetical protein